MTASGSTEFLDRLRDVWDRIFGPEPDPSIAMVADLSAIAELAGSGSPHHLRRVVPLVLNQDAEVAASAGAAVRGALAGLPPRELVRADEALRRHYWMVGSGNPPRREIRPADVARLAAVGENATAVLGAVSLHADGYLREAAVRALAGRGGGDELPFLLLRLNDWVEQVRAPAFEAVRARLVPGYAAHFARHLWLLGRLEDGVRADADALLVDAWRFLAGPGRSAVRAALDSDDAWVRRRCYRLLLDAPTDDAAATIRMALRDADLTIRLRAIRAAGAVLDADELRAVVAIAIADPYARVRREALDLWTRHFPESAEPTLRAALLDPHASMREVARFDLRRMGASGFDQFYRAALDAAPRAALYGLAETGDADDAPRVEKFLSHPLPSVRRAAVVALAQLDPATPPDIFLRALEDTSPSVSRAARRVLESGAVTPDAERLWAIVERGAEIHARANALTLLARVGKWASIAWLLRARGLGEEPLARIADREIELWIARFNHKPYQPTAGQLERMAGALDAAALDADRERMLRFLMRGYRI